VLRLQTPLTLLPAAATSHKHALILNTSTLACAVLRTRAAHKRRTARDAGDLSPTGMRSQVSSGSASLQALASGACVGTMVEGVGATVLADSVISWAIGQGLTALAQWARLAVHCKSYCLALADLLEGQQLRAIARDLDSLTQAEAFAQVRVQYDRLCEQLEEAQYVVLRCRQTGAWNAVTRVRMGRRIEAVHGALEATAKEL
jgi:hypothetical protein